MRRKINLNTRIKIFILNKPNVLKYIFADGSWMAVRPSGTEPKIKVYYSIVDPDRENAKTKLETIRKTINGIINA